MADDAEGAVREVVQVYELIKTHQPLIHHCCHNGQEPTTTLAQSLLSEALRALNIALSVIKQQQIESRSSTAAALAQRSSSSPASAAADPSKGATSTSARRSSKRRRSVIEGNNPSWVNLTTVPYGDGYEWRKYGEKRINGSQFTRRYYRCTYKHDTGCPATKQIQQKDNSDPPVFQVTYNNEHTCNCTTAANKHSFPLQAGCCDSGGVNDPSNDAHSVVNLEPPVSLPTLLVEEEVPSFQQEPFPFSEYGASVLLVASNTDSSCMDAVQSNECLNIEHTMTGDDALHDLELFLLCDSFKYY